MSYTTSARRKQSVIPEEILVPGIALPHGAYPHALILADTLFLSGVGPREADSKSFSKTFEGQCEKVLNNVGAILKYVRQRYPDVEDIKFVDVVAYFTDLERCSQFKTEFHRHFPNQTPIIDCKEINALPGSIQIEMKVLAQVVRRDMEVNQVNLISAGGDQLQAPPLDFQKQFDLVFDSLTEDLKRQGSHLSQVLDVEVFMKDLADDGRWRTYNAAYDKRFQTAPRPARTTIGVKSLPHDWAIQIRARALKAPTPTNGSTE